MRRDYNMKPQKRINFEHKKEIISDLRQSIQEVKSYPPDKKPSGNVKVYGAIGMMPTPVQREVGVQYQKARLFYEATSSNDSLSEKSAKINEKGAVTEVPTVT